MNKKIAQVKAEVAKLESGDGQRFRNAIDRGWNRRDVMKLIMASGFTVAAAHQIFSDQQAAVAATPKKGGSVRWAGNVQGPDDQLDPILFTSGTDYTRGRVIYNGLCQLGEGLVPQPELAESFEPNGDATEWTFKIQKNVTFHDGKKLTADDVVYSMNRHLGEDSVSVFKSVLASVKEWKKLGPYEVKAIMNTSNSDLPSLLGLFQAKIVQKDSKGDGIGTGPYVMEEFSPGVKSVHIRNENYWREPAHLDAVEITAITDPVARVNAVIAGDVDMGISIEPSAFRQIESAPGVDLLSVPAAQQIGICCLKNTMPGENDDFVRGMQFIQDRERVVKRILKGRGTVANDHPISAAHGGDFCHELPQRAYDPDQAKHFFKKAGITEATVHVAPVAVGVEEIVLLMQANLSKIGFKLNIKKVPSDGYWGAVWMKEPINVVNWLMRPTVNAQMSVQFAPEAAWNDTYWKNARMGELLSSSLAELDADKRHAMYCEMQTLVHEGSGMVIPAFANVNDGIRSNVKGIPKIPIGPVGGCEWPEFVWLA
jgi:peptide/nickel transport system substrate-binding protein